MARQTSYENAKRFMEIAGRHDVSSVDGMRGVIVEFTGDVYLSDGYERMSDVVRKTKPSQMTSARIEDLFITNYHYFKRILGERETPGRLEQKAGDFIVDLPAPWEVAFRVATFQYDKIKRRGVVAAASEEDAVKNYLFSKFRDKRDEQVPIRIISALRERGRGSLDSYAFRVPEIGAEDGGEISLSARELMEEDALRAEIASKRPGADAAKLAKELMDFYRNVIIHRLTIPAMFVEYAEIFRIMKLLSVMI
jgi:hypothetical protein